MTLCQCFLRDTTDRTVSYVYESLNTIGVFEVKWATTEFSKMLGYQPHVTNYFRVLTMVPSTREVNIKTSSRLTAVTLILNFDS